ncbi:MAG: heme biosynthesis protein HemY [Halioglobus sp.]|nr:heme biosynthesis protein HemY [Halioglobus sp.]
MRRLFAIILVALLLGVGVVAVIETDPGYVLLSYGNYTLETSLWVGLVLLVSFVVITYWVMRLIYRLLSGQRSLRGWLGTRRTHRAARLTTDGTISFIEGNWERARRQLLRALEHSATPLTNYLLAAQASAQLHDADRMKEYLGAAGDAVPRAAPAVELVRAQLLLRAGQYRQALQVLEQAGGSVARQPRALTLRYRACLGLRDWRALRDLLPELKRHGALSEDELQQLGRRVHQQLLVAGAGTDRGASVPPLAEIWKQVPAQLKQDPEVLRCYVRGLLELGEHAAAEKVLVSALKQRWSSNLVREYAYVHSDNVAQQLARAETWLAEHDSDAQLLLCLGRLSARDKLWGKARDYYESSYRLQPSAEACAELGRLLSALGEPAVAAAYFREGLLLLESDLPALPMPQQGLPQSRRLART